MTYPAQAVERAMKIQEVITRAMSGEYTWLRAAEIIGLSPRSMRRWRLRYELRGYDGLLDRRRGVPSPRAAPFEQVHRVLRLYREKYQGFNGRHFHEIARREHGVRLSYSYVKKALQTAGLLAKRRPRGRHRQRREPRACFGEMLHLDGSPHAWLALCPEQRQVAIHALDDATGRLLALHLCTSEGTSAVMRVLREVLVGHGIPMSAYTDRAGWAFHTPRAGGPCDRKQLTQVGRALRRLGIEHIPAYSPQARGRSERFNRTLQDRLVNELRLAGIRAISEANAYIRERFLPALNDTFARAPKDPASAFVPLGDVDLEQILCHEAERRVNGDNTVVLGRVRLQIAKQPGRRSCARLRVLVRRHLDATHSVWFGGRCLARYDRNGQALPSPAASRPGRPPQRAAARPLRGEATGRVPPRSSAVGQAMRPASVSGACGSWRTYGKRKRRVSHRSLDGAHPAPPTRSTGPAATPIS